MSEKKVVTIARSRWARGKKNRPVKSGGELFDDELENALYNPGLRTMCCLGFVCRAEGAKVASIKGVGLPYEADGWSSPDWLDAVANRAAEENDDESITDRERERRLHEIFADTPIRLKFVP